eukprot:8959577-Lingulodinium_polyedra.AAC.1
MRVRYAVNSLLGQATSGLPCAIQVAGQVGYCGRFPPRTNSRPGAGAKFVARPEGRSQRLQRASAA